VNLLSPGAVPLLVVQTDEDRPASPSSRASPSSTATPGRPKGAPSRGAGKQPVTMLNDRVLVNVPQSEGERRSRAGILIPATAQVQRRLSWAEVAAVGPHVRTIRSGDTVLFNPEECFEVDVQGEEYLILRERDVHAIASERMDGGTGLYL
jgi:chaperonin GroES